jgi:hypothetical protein
MANYLASIFGTEQDKVNCKFYYELLADFERARAGCAVGEVKGRRSLLCCFAALLLF